jgi:hypothetical protein
MAHRCPPRRFLKKGALLAAMVVLSACSPGFLDDDAGPEPGTGADCTELCDIEDFCELRDFDDCVAQSCDGGPTRVPSDTDDCMLDAVAADGGTCLDVVLCTCEESCDLEEQCGLDADPSCVSTCETLITAGDPEVAYEEARCRIELNSCDLAACGGEGFGP